MFQYCIYNNKGIIIKKISLVHYREQYLKIYFHSWFDIFKSNGVVVV